MKKPILKRGWLNKQDTLHITSPYGPRRLKDHAFHYGIDIRAEVGTKIYSPISGRLTCYGVSRSAGLWCCVSSGNLCLVFMHLSECVLGQSAGASTSVSEGSFIGKTGGAKGNRLSGVYSTGPHLHFEYRWIQSGRAPGTSSNAIDPIFFLSEKLIGSVKKNSVSSGIDLKVDKKTGEVETYNIGDGKPIKYSNVSTSTLDVSKNENGAFETSDTETEIFNEDYTTEDNVELEEKFAPGIWQIIKLAMDKEVQDYMLYDATISMQTGSIMGFFNKACQRPLVEFFGDTFGNQYFFIVRKPPFDSRLMIRALNNQYLLDNDVNKSVRDLEKKQQDTLDEGLDFNRFNPDEDYTDDIKTLENYRAQYGFGSEYWNKVCELEKEIRAKQEDIHQNRDNYIIHDDEIVNSSISFNTQGIYSWYQYYPQFDMSGDDMQYLVPAVLFPEYAAIWGSRALQIQSQYRSFRGTGARDDVKNDVPNETVDKICGNVLDDLRYLIECNAYAPFVRQGTITITGTRRIKRGMFIQVILESGVEEIFYVESVSQNYSINGHSVSRTTTLTVSHGMVKQYIKRDMDVVGSYSYFDIIDFGNFDENKDNVNVNTWKSTISKWKVNRDVFKFFLKRMQFIKSDTGMLKD